MIFKIELVHDGHVVQSYLIDPQTPVTDARLTQPFEADGVRVRGFRFLADAHTITYPAAPSLVDELRDLKRNVTLDHAGVIDRAIKALEAVHDD